jgi:hypothetical protein
MPRTEPPGSDRSTEVRADGAHADTLARAGGNARQLNRGLSAGPHPNR